MKKKSHLPFFGIGPLYVALIVGLTVLGMILSAKGYLGSGIIAGFKVPMIVVGILIGVLGLFIWLYALFVSRIDDGIRNNRLVTDGIYAWCRNPLYTGWMFICIGVSLLSANLWMLILPFIFWALMAFMMKLTEERWLHNLYGAQYEDYCRRVNRTWPWFPSKNK